MSEIRQIQVDGVNYDLVISEDEVSATSAAESAAEALSYKNQAATSATNAATSATAAATSATNAANSAEEAIISARSAESAAYIAGGVSSIIDPNEDGNLVVVPPNISDSGWAVRYDVDQTALVSASEQAQARKNIAAGGTNPNLLDNPWFRVNQRGQTSGTLLGDYVADRWRPSYGSGGVTWSRTDDVVTVCSTTGTSQGYLFQNLEPSLSAWLANRTVTLSIMRGDYTIMATSFVWPSSGNRSAIIGDDADGNTISFLANADTKRINVYKNYTALNVRAIKLELGSVSTLANDTPPDYGTELAKCQRYFLRLSYGTVASPIAFGYCYSSTQARVLINTPVTMRTNPSISASAIGSTRINANGTYLTPSAISDSGVVYSHGVYVPITISGATSGAVAIWFSNDTNYIDLSADLL